MTQEQMHTIKEFGEMLTKQIDKINKKGDISPDELQRMDKAIDIIKDISVICAMEEYGQNPEEETYSSVGYYGRNSRSPYMNSYSDKRDSMGRYSSRPAMPMIYSRDDGMHKMRSDLEMKLANATDERERQMYTKWLRDLDG